MKSGRNDELANLFVSVRGVPSELNLDTEARRLRYLEKIQIGEGNPLLQIDDASNFVLRVTRESGGDWSYGGYLEDRGYFLRGSYLEQFQSFVHAGIDINVPAGTPVTVPFSGTVLKIDDDTPETLGWGPRVFVQPDGLDSLPHFIFAHLQDIEVTEGQKISKGNKIAVVGAPPLNGGWFPHLHVQCVVQAFYNGEFREQPRSLDGYFPSTEMDKYAQIYPDPFTVLRTILKR